MADLHFSTTLTWQGTGREGEGQVTLGGQTVTYSGPESMGGKGVGSSPEELLIAAVSACYSGTLLGVLRKRGLAAERVEIEAEGTVTGYPVQSKFARLRVSPTVYGGDASQTGAYQEAAVEARDKCFIGKTIAGNVTYDVGDVRITSA
ncbi:MAG: OsmC family protein [Alicyclobacillus sp.]|nr:OsmC family protein [Alicyclobacillus sp.]